MPLACEYPTAAIIPESGTGMTTSASTGASSASFSPIRWRLPATSRPSKCESGRARYTDSKTPSAPRGAPRRRLPRPVAAAGDLAAVEMRVGAGEVHVLEDAQRPARALRAVARQAPVVYYHYLARFHVAQVLGADYVQAAGLA